MLVTACSNAWFHWTTTVSLTGAACAWVGYINHPQWDPLLLEAPFRLLRQRLGVSDEMRAQLAAARTAVVAQSR